MSNNSISYLQYRYYHKETSTFPLEILDPYLPSKTFPLKSITISTEENERYIYNIYIIYNNKKKKEKDPTTQFVSLLDGEVFG